MKNKKGITLIALVITIIVLLILAAVSITALTDEDKGIVIKAKDAREKTNSAKEKEKDDIKELFDYMEDENVARNYDGAVMDLFTVAMSYYNNKNNLIYGETETIYDIEKTNQMDCSSFIQLVIEGIPYEQSLYATSKNTPLKYGYNFPSNPYTSDRASLGGGYDVNATERYYAHEIARYAYDNGYSFSVNSDYSNLQLGDIIFYDFSPYGNQSKFLSIDHAAIVIGSKDGKTLKVLHSNNSGDLVKFYTYSEEHVPVLAARFPFNSDTIINQENLITSGGDVEYTGYTSGLIYQYKVGEGQNINYKLKPNTPYTFICKIDYDKEDTGLYVGLRASYSTGESDETIDSYQGCETPEDNIYTFRFVTDGSKEISIIKPYILGTASSGTKQAKIYYAELYEGAK